VPALDFSSLLDAVTIVEQRTGLTRTDEWDTLLEETADPLVPTYRPYAVVALILGNAQHYAKVLEAEGVIFSDPIVTIRALLHMQEAWDEALDLDVPTQWTVTKLRSMLLSGGVSVTPVFGRLGFS